MVQRSRRRYNYKKRDGRTDGRWAGVGTKLICPFFSYEKAGKIIMQQCHQARSIISSCLAEQFYAAQHSHPRFYILLPVALQL